ncbi:MAG: transglycosylase domain-containing protein, partial [Clostridioides sp.]|nr:transglycosylase domain-containing protein [Clostridioides sp.]
MKNDNNDDNKIRRKRVSSNRMSSTPIDRKKHSDDNKKLSKSKKSKVESHKKSTKYKKLKIFGMAFLICCVIGIATAAGIVFAALRDVKPISEASLSKYIYQTTTIKYLNGEKLSTAPTVTKRTPVELDQMSKYLKDAVVSIEDERFYEHKGVDFTGIARSVVKYATGTKQGASTIPMQVSKLLLTSSEQTITRKIKDMYYATEMSKTLSKDKILEMYLNIFSVGQGFSGAESGARGYFDKSASDLTLAESALLAGSTKNPNKYAAYKTAKIDGSETKEDFENKLLLFTNSPNDSLDEPTEVDFNMIEKLLSWDLITNDEYKQLKDATLVVRKAVANPTALERQKVVLKKMLDLKKITQSEYESALAEKITIKIPKKDDSVASSVEDYIASEVINALIAQGNTESEAKNLFYNGGLTINTTIDPKIQQIMEEEYAKTSNFPGTHTIADTDAIQPQSGMVIMDYKTGEIRGMIGGRNIKNKLAFNRATNPHQPGSTIKPLSIYTPAIDTLQITQSTAVSDERNPSDYKFASNQKWNPKSTTKMLGSMSVRYALEQSSNTIAVKVSEMLGDTEGECLDIMIDYLKNFGITSLYASDLDTGKDKNFAALTLGGMYRGISPLEMTAAYGTLANGGVYTEPIVFTTITSYDGQLLVNNTPQTLKVVAPEVAYVMTDMLSGVVSEGLGGKASISSGMPVAGKTGTT